MRLLSIALATLVLAACATQPQPTPQAPGGGRLDAKTQLETVLRQSALTTKKKRAAFCGPFFDGLNVSAP
jgi:uncharacterized lipoprotein YajG